MKFKIGDRVRCVSGTWYENVGELEGTVVKLIEDREYDNIGIRFDEKVRYGCGHSLGILKGEDKYRGYYVADYDLVHCKENNKGGY